MTESDNEGTGPDESVDEERKARFEADRAHREALARRIREQPDEALKSEFSSSFLALLEQGRLSVAVSTYQAGKVVFLRADNGKLNTHFCSFNRPMGVALSGNRLAVGTNNEV